MAAVDWSQPIYQLPLSTEMLQKPTTLSFLGRRSNIPRPLSDATEIFDTDNEEDSSDVSVPLSLDDGSESTISSPGELVTPLTGGLGGFDFHFDEKPVKGPQGPHLFQLASDDSSEEFMINLSQPRPFASLNSAVAELDERQVRTWTPRQVADWMAEAGFEPSVVEKFLIHDISGSVLLDLQFEDLKELDISSFGKRHRVMSSIQHLRNSSMITMEAPISRTPSRSGPSPRALTRSVRPEERLVIEEARSRSQRRTRRRGSSDDVTPAESISIVAIEQLLPKPHSCSKGENCAKWRKQQRKLQKLQQEFVEEAAAAAPEPSVVGSSDVLGPTPAAKITAESLKEVQPRDAQESVRQFLNFQHLHSRPTTPLSENLQSLPRLTIPEVNQDSTSSARTPISALRHPTQLQTQLKTELLNDPFHYGGVASPADIYRINTPMSATDIPVTMLAVDPCERDASQSVPPDMRYGATNTETVSAPKPSSRRHRRQPSFTPSIAPVRETVTTPVKATCITPPVDTSEIELANHAGWMRKRTTKFLRHEWQDNYCSLSGNRLVTMEDDATTAKPLESIDVDDYTLHAYSLASSSKLKAAFKKNSRRGSSTGPEPSFAFSLIPDTETSRGTFTNTSNKTHHFAVNSGKDRVEWMRKLMLAKALKKNDSYQI